MTSRTISMKPMFLGNRISDLLIGQVPFSRRVAGLRSGDANRAAKSDAVDYYQICLINKNFTIMNNFTFALSAHTINFNNVEDTLSSKVENSLERICQGEPLAQVYKNERRQWSDSVDEDRVYEEISDSSFQGYVRLIEEIS